MLNTIRKYLRPYFPQKLVNYLYHLPLAYLASRMYGDPGADLEIIGVTGTDGKTTTTTLIYHILKVAKKKVAMISTVEARVGRKSINTGFHVTTPDPFALQAILRRFRSQKVRYVVLETTSHGLDQFRFFPLKPKIAVLTNITHEHLDYHRTFKKYRDAKLKLLQAADHAVVNKDLTIFPELNRKLSKKLFSTYSIFQDSQLKPDHIEYFPDKTSFRLGKTNYSVPLVGEYNLYNTLASVATALLLDIAPTDIKKALSSFPGIKGRLELVPNSRDLHTYVDFAHTPNALENVLSTLRTRLVGKGNLIVVFGAAGLRDSSKRALMGGVAGRYADKIVLTSEDPRTEDPSQIVAMIKAGIPKKMHSKVTIELDRASAIDLAINKLSNPGDWIVTCGKGHETSMCYGTLETPWSEFTAMKNALESKNA